MDHALPSQCSARVTGEPMPQSPTAQQSEEVVHETPRSSTAEDPSGVATIDHALPSQCSARPGFPTAQHSALVMQVTASRSLCVAPVAGVGTKDHSLPSQCSTSADVPSWPPIGVSSPTAQQS